MEIGVTYKIAETETDFRQAAGLFKEYVQLLGVDLSFQDVEKELKEISKQYNKPAGTLLLACDNGLAIGCVAVRRLDDETAELKRMYVQGNYRGRKIGVHLLERSLPAACTLGYKKIRLDTLDNMAKAQELYKAFGFYEIPPYCYNPIEGAIFMEKVL